MSISVVFVDDAGETMAPIKVPLIALQRVDSSVEQIMWDELRAASRDLGNPGHHESSEYLVNRIRKARRIGHDWAFISHATQLTGHRVRELWADGLSQDYLDREGLVMYDKVFSYELGSRSASIGAVPGDLYEARWFIDHTDCSTYQSVDADEVLRVYLAKVDEIKALEGVK